MQFTTRNKQILLLLLIAKEPILEKKLAEVIGVSLRTVQREVEYIDRAMVNYELLLKKKKNFGVWLDGDEIKKEQLLQQLQKDRQPVISDKEQRIKYLTFELLRDKSPKKLYYFSHHFGVSEATISSDLELVDEWLKPNHLSIIRKPGYGVVLKGKEKHYRETIQRFIKENINDESMRTLLYKDSSAVFDAVGGVEGSRNIYELLNSAIISKVSKTLDTMEEPRLKQMTDNSYVGLIMHIAIALDRIIKQEFLEEEAQEIIYTLDEDYELVNKIIERLQLEFQINIPSRELGYLLLHIKGAKLNYSKEENKHYRNQVESELLLDLIDKMIDMFSPKDAFELKKDEDFIRGLLIHLEPALIRMKNDLMIYNPLLSEIKQEYAQTFEQCKRAIKEIEHQFGCLVSDEEIGFIAIHFGAAMERNLDRKHRQRVVHIGIICASGFGVARLMLAKIKNSLKNQVSIAAYGKDEVTPFVIGKTDFFVSSFRTELTGLDCLQVSPLVLAGDLDQIKVKVLEYSRLPGKAQETDFTRQLDQVNLAVVQIKNLIRSYQLIRINESVTVEELMSCLSKRLTTSATNAAVLKADLMDREKIMTQIFPEACFGLFHCRTKAVTKIGFYTVSPRKGGGFKDPTLKKIKAGVVLLMPVNENREFDAQLLGHISSSLIEEPTFLQQIFTGEEEKIREQLQKVLKKYFNDFLNKV